MGFIDDADDAELADEGVDEAVGRTQTTTFWSMGRLMVVGTFDIVCGFVATICDMV